jgi:hypothetical protein
VIEPENAKGEPFGDSELEEVVLGAQMSPPSELPERMLAEIRAWQPPSVAQQDDLTIVVIEVRWFLLFGRCAGSRLFARVLSVILRRELERAILPCIPPGQIETKR